MIRKIVILFFLSFFSNQAFATDNILKYKADLTLEGSGPWYQLLLDSKIQLQSLSPTLGDIRIIDANGNAQPYAFYYDDNSNKKNNDLVRHKYEKADIYPLYSNVSNNVSSSNIKVEKTGDNISISLSSAGAKNEPDGNNISTNTASLQGYILDLKQPINAIEMLDINWEPQKDGFYPYRLEISSDMENWRLIENGDLYHLTNNDGELSKSKINLHNTSGRFLRIRWLDGTKTPIIKSAFFTYILYSAKPQAGLVWSDIFQTKRIKTEDNNIEIYQLNFPTSHDFQAIKLSLPEGYTLAPFTLYGESSPMSNNFQSLRQGIFYQLLGKNGDVERLDSVELPQNPLSAIKIIIDKRGGGFNLDSLPIQLALPENHLVFLARGQAPYHMEIGEDGLTSSALDFSTLVPDATLINDKRISKAELATPFTKVIKIPIEEKVPSFEWSKVILWSVLIIGIAFLLLMAFLLLRQSENINKNK